MNESAPGWLRKRAPRRVYRSIPVLIVAFTFLGCTASPSSTEAARRLVHADCKGCSEIAIVGVDVIPMTSPETIRHDQIVLIRDGKISAVGPPSDVEIPPGAMQIDGRDRFLIPALADMHVHLEHFDDPGLLALFPRYGVTLVRNMDGRPAVLEWRDAVREGHLSGPEIFTAGPILDGDPPIRPDNRIVAGPADARKAVQEQATAGYDFIKTYSNLSSETYQAVVDAAVEEGLRVAGHAPRDVELTELLGKHWSLEHLTDLGETVEADQSPFRNRWHWSKLFVGMPIDEEQLQRLARRIAAAEMWVMPTLVQPARAHADAETLEEWMRAPELALIPEEGVGYWRERLESTAARMDEEDWILVETGRANRRAIASALHRAGASLAVGTDTPNPFVIPGLSVHEEMELLVESGMTDADALASATVAAAAMLGKTDWGMIEAGNEADLILLRDNPLEDIRATRSIVGVMVNGEWNDYDANGL